MPAKLDEPVKPFKVITIPQPPPITLSPTKSIALVTIAVGDEAVEMSNATREHTKRYAERLGADLVVLGPKDTYAHADWAMSVKFSIPRVLEYYERIVYVDADVLLRRGCIDILDSAGNADWAAVDEKTFQKLNDGGKSMIARFEALNRGSCPFYFNCGVYVASHKVHDLLLPPLSPIAHHHCSEQDWVNVKIYKAYKEGSIKLRLLDRRCNWQNWQDPGFKEAPDDAVLHWSGSGNRHERPKLISFAVKEYPA